MHEQINLEHETCKTVMLETKIENIKNTPRVENTPEESDITKTIHQNHKSENYRT